MGMTKNENSALRILLVDDNRDISDMLSQYLKIKGHDCLVANGGRVGLNLILQEKFDIIVLDLAMPEFSGYDVIKTLQKQNVINNYKILVLTASSITDPEIEQLTNGGVRACLKKPVQLKELMQVISSIR